MQRVRATTTARRDVERARIILLASRGLNNVEIARQIGVSDRTVRKWRARFATAGRVESLRDARRSGRPARVPLAVRCAVIKLACSTPEPSEPPYCAHWTVGALRARLAEQTDFLLSETEIRRTLRAELIRPHRVRIWLHSPDPDFQAKVERICALYRKPPPGATVLCVDEKTGMQALERRFAGRPATPGRPPRREFEYVRHGTRALIAAFDVRTGRVFARCGRRRRACDLERFMEALAKRYPSGEVYVVWDNLNIHHGAQWAKFSARHGGRFHFVHTPLHASWVNQIEVWFSILGRRVLRHASFARVGALTERVMAFVRHWNARQAHPFRWTFRGRWRTVAARARLPEARHDADPARRAPGRTLAA